MMRSYPFTSQVTYDDEGLPLYDRAIDSAFLRNVFAKYFSDGIFYKPTNALQVVADTGMKVAVEPGCCHIQGAIGIEDSRRTLIVQASDSLDRIDTVVARLDLSLDARDIDLYIVKGTAATSPQPPALTRDATVWELGLADLFVAKNSSTITQQRITDTRLNASRCGMVAQTIGTLDTTPYFNQIQAALASIQTQAVAQLNQMEFAFDSWLETIKGKLGDDPATALQSQVDDLQAAVGGMPLELSAGTNSIQIVADENRVGNVEVNGFTTQTGSGDASPSNVREIENAAELNKVFTFNGTNATFVKIDISSQPNLLVFDVNMSNVVKSSEGFSTWLPMPKGFDEQNGKEGIRAFSASSGFRICVYKSRLSGETVDAFNTYLKANPLTIAYQSTTDTGKFYTGIAVEQDGAYHCDIVELKDRLNSGDKLDVNVQSGYDAVKALTGDETYKTYDAWLPGAVEVHNVVADAIKVTGYTTKADILCNHLPVSTAEIITSKSNNRPAISQGGTRGDLVFLYLGPEYNTIDLAKQRIKALHDAGTPIKVYYKLETKGSPLRIKREEHAKKTYVFTGTEAITSGTAASKTYFALPGINVKAPSTMSEVGSVKCNMLATVTQNDVTKGDYRICNSTDGNFLFHFTDDITTVEQAKQILAEKFAAGTPFVIEYELKALDVFADAPVDIKNHRGAFTVSSEAGSTLTVGINPASIPTLEELGAEPAFAKNTAFNKNFGAAADTVCEGNDARLSDARRASNITMNRSGTTLNITYS